MSARCSRSARARGAGRSPGRRPRRAGPAPAPNAPPGRSRLRRAKRGAHHRERPPGASSCGSPRASAPCGPPRHRTPRCRITSRVMRRISAARASASRSARRHLGPGRLRDQGLVLAHPLAVEGGQQQLALAHVLRAGQRDHRVRSHDRSDRRARRAGRRHLRGRREDLLDGGGAAEHHQLGSARRERDREGVPDVPLAPRHHPSRREGPDQCLQRRRHARARGKPTGWARSLRARRRAGGCCGGVLAMLTG